MSGNENSTSATAPVGKINPFTGKPYTAPSQPDKSTLEHIPPVSKPMSNPFASQPKSRDTLKPSVPRLQERKTVSNKSRAPNTISIPQAPALTPLGPPEAKLGLPHSKTSLTQVSSRNSAHNSPASPKLSAFVRGLLEPAHLKAPTPLHDLPAPDALSITRIAKSAPRGTRAVLQETTTPSTPKQSTAVCANAVPTSALRKRAAASATLPPPTIGQRYTKVLGDLDNPFVQFLRRTHGVTPAAHASSIVTGNGANFFGPGSSAQTPQSQAPAEGETSLKLFFPDEWDSGIAYRYRSSRAPEVDAATDGTIAEVLMKAEDWTMEICKAMLNIEGVKDKGNSNEIKMFSDSQLDLKAIEATSRLILTAIVHRCVVGFCGNQKRNDAKPIDRGLTCAERLTAVINGLYMDKRICRDVFLEDSKLTVFVHQPLTYLKKKGLQEDANKKKAEVYRVRRGDGQDGANTPSQSSTQATPASNKASPSTGYSPPAHLAFKSTSNLAMSRASNVPAATPTSRVFMQIPAKSVQDTPVTPATPSTMPYDRHKFVTVARTMKLPPQLPKQAKPTPAESIQQGSSNKPATPGERVSVQIPAHPGDSNTPIATPSTKTSKKHKSATTRKPTNKQPAGPITQLQPLPLNTSVRSQPVVIPPASRAAGRSSVAQPASKYPYAPEVVATTEQDVEMQDVSAAELGVHVQPPTATSPKHLHKRKRSSKDEGEDERSAKSAFKVQTSQNDSISQAPAPIDNSSVSDGTSLHKSSSGSQDEKKEIVNQARDHGDTSASSPTKKRRLS